MASKNKTNKSSTVVHKQKKEFGLGTELLLLLVLLVAIFLLISDFGMGGRIGAGARNVMFGLTGAFAYVLPVLLFVSVAFMIANKGRSSAIRKLIICLIFGIICCGLMQFITEKTNTTRLQDTFFDFYTDSAVYHTGGGAIGGMIYTVMNDSLGTVGSYLCLGAGLMACVIILTRKSFFGLLNRIFGQIGSSVQTSWDSYKEEAPERKKRQEERRQQKAEERKQRLLEKEMEEDDEIWEEDEYESIASAEVKEEDSVSSEEEDLLDEMEDDLSIAPSVVSTKKAGGKKKSPKKAKVVSSNKSDNNITKIVNPIQMRLEDVYEEDETEDLAPDLRFHMRMEPEEEDILSEQETIIPETKARTKSVSDPDAEPKAPARKKNPRSSREEQAENIESVEREIQSQNTEVEEYEFPPIDLLEKSTSTGGDSTDYLRKTAVKIQDTLKNFGVNVTVTDVSRGPAVTRYELHPEQGVKVSRIVNLADDLKLNLEAADIRIEAPIPGKAAVGIEVPNKSKCTVSLRELVQSEEFRQAASKLTFAVGKDIAGKPVVTNLAKMPHLLIAGATGSGKSVCINTLIMSILYKARPDEVKLIMIDPKVVELSVYNNIPHLLIPVVTDPKKASGALNWAVQEMTNRYNIFAEYHVRQMSDYNKKIKKMTFPEGQEAPKPMAQIVIIVDELADLMMVAPNEVEDAICRLAQLARAAGIHLIIATQRPSVNVITGLIKANMPSRIAFAVTSGIDSRTILDMVGAEKLLGEGDMLFYPKGYTKPVRVQGAFVTDEEVSAVVDFLGNKNPNTVYSEEIVQQVNSTSFTAIGGGSSDELDEYFEKAGRFIIEKDKASIGMLQRMFKIGFNRAARIMDQLCEAGVVGPEEGTKPRKILMSEEEFETYLEESV